MKHPNGLVCGLAIVAAAAFVSVTYVILRSPHKPSSPSGSDMEKLTTSYQPSQTPSLSPRFIDPTSSPIRGRTPEHATEEPHESSVMSSNPPSSLPRSTQSPRPYPTSTPTVGPASEDANEKTQESSDTSLSPPRPRPLGPLPLPTQPSKADPTSCPKAEQIPEPTEEKTQESSVMPSSPPTVGPSPLPTRLPTLDPSSFKPVTPAPEDAEDKNQEAADTRRPSPLPAYEFTPLPTQIQTIDPSSFPTISSTPEDVEDKNQEPFNSSGPSPLPTSEPSPTQSQEPDPTSFPTIEPTPEDAEDKTLEPFSSHWPSPRPTSEPVPLPTQSPEPDPTSFPTIASTPEDTEDKNQDSQGPSTSPSALTSSNPSAVSHGHMMIVYQDFFLVESKSCNGVFPENRREHEDCFINPWESPEAREDLFAACTQMGREVERLSMAGFLQKIQNGGHLPDGTCDQVTVGFLEDAASYGIEVYALLSTNDENFSEKDHVRFVYLFNKNCGTSTGKFAGVHINNEIFSKYRDDCSENGVNHFLRLGVLDYLQMAVYNAHGLPVQHSMSWAWAYCPHTKDLLTVTWNGSTKPYHEHMMDIVDHVDLQVGSNDPETMKARTLIFAEYWIKTKKPGRLFTLALANPKREDECKQSFAPQNKGSSNAISFCGKGDRTEEGMFSALDEVTKAMPGIVKRGIHFYGGVYSTGMEGFPKHKGQRNDRTDADEHE